MTKVLFRSWSTGLNTVRLIKLVREIVGVPLGEALGTVNRFLEGKAVGFCVGSSTDAERLAREATALGVQADCISIPESRTAAS